MSKKIVIALGGNALQISGESPSYENQAKNIQVAMKQIIELVKQDYSIVITHGNGPQVGRMLMQQAVADSEETPSLPFDAVGAMSQASIGYQIEQVLENELAKQNLNQEIATMITQVVVDPDDPAFNNASKPIGPFYTKEEAEQQARESGYEFKEDADRGYRRVVASPQAQEIVELEAIESLLDTGHLVICCGGGGIPVVQQNGAYHGVAAVIDKDLATSLLAKELNADYLVILTAVESVALNYGKANEKRLNHVSIEELKTYQTEGHFAPGSMLPKVQAAIDFASATNNQAIITTLDALNQAITTEEVGTIIN